MSREVPEGPHERLVGRLRELSDAVTQGPDAVRREFTMRVPAEPERDADLVLSTAAAELDRLRAARDALDRALREAIATLERDGDEWGICGRLRTALTPNAEVSGGRSPSA